MTADAGRRRFLGRVLPVLLLAFMLLWTPLLNGYPLLHSDSGTYIWSSVIFQVPQDRPIGYGLFLRATQLFPTLWAVVMVQALGTAYLMWRVTERLLVSRIANESARAWTAFGIGAVTIGLTTVSTYAGMVIADILASWILLATILVLVSTRIFDRILAGLALWAGIWSHNSHVLLALGLAVPLGIYLIYKVRHKTLDGLDFWFAALAIALVSMFGINLYLRAGAEVTRGGDTIWLNRFAESGVLQQTLALNCAGEGWALCAFAETIRAHQGEARWFLFGADSPVRQVGWERGADEQRAIVTRALTCCWQKIIENSAGESWRQMWLLEIQRYVTPLSEEMNAVKAIRKFFSNEVTAFLASRQQTGLYLPTRLLPVNEGAVQVVSLVAALGLMGFALVRRDWRSLALLGGTFYFLVLNATVMATFSGAVTRYQGRVYWLLPFMVLVVAAGLRANRAADESPLRA